MEERWKDAYKVDELLDFDTKDRFEQEEGYTKADFGLRLVALLIDNFITGILFVPALGLFAYALFEASGNTGAWLPYAFLCLVLPFAFMFLKDSMWEGQSPGKRIMGLQVINEVTNRPCDRTASFVRNFIMFLLNLFSIGWLLGLVLVLSDEEKGKRLGDRVANTMVVEVDRY